MTPPTDPAAVERVTDPFLRDTFAAEWARASDCDPTDDPDFLEKAEAAGLCELVSVDDDALNDPFASERGIEPNGLMWRLTPAGAARIERSDHAR